jgi:type II secretory pathway pseudopilin PulG
MRTNEQGFTLISVMIAVVILTIGILALAKTSATVVRTSANAATRSEAVSLARAYMEEVRSRPPANLISETLAFVDREGVPDANGPYSRQVVVTDLASNLKSVQVVVTMPGSSVPVELITLAFVGSL